MNTHRRVPQEKLSELSPDARMEAILRFSDWNTLLFTIKSNMDVAYQVFQERTLKDIMISERHKKLLAFIFERLNNGSTK